MAMKNEYQGKGFPGKILWVLLVIIQISLCCHGPINAAEIHDAVKTGNLDRVKRILTADPNLIDTPDIIGHTPLSLSATYARWDIFQYLLETGANVHIITKSNSTVAHSVCQHNRPDMMELLLQKGGYPCLKIRDVYGEYTPMLRAVQRGCNDVIAYLLENGSSPDESTREGWNALHIAAKCGHRHLYGMLIAKGVSLDVKDFEGKTPMEYDFHRPDPIPFDQKLSEDYIGRYTWEGAPEGLGIRIFMEGDRLMLDDYGLDELYPIGEDLFYCSQDPWTLKFYRDQSGAVDRVELFFLRRKVTVNKMK